MGEAGKELRNTLSSAAPITAVLVLYACTRADSPPVAAVPTAGSEDWARAIGVGHRSVSVPPAETGHSVPSEWNSRHNVHISREAFRPSEQPSVGRFLTPELLPAQNGLRESDVSHNFSVQLHDVVRGTTRVRAAIGEGLHETDCACTDRCGRIWTASRSGSTFFRMFRTCFISRPEFISKTL